MPRSASTVDSAESLPPHRGHGDAGERSSTAEDAIVISSSDEGDALSLHLTNQAPPGNANARESTDGAESPSGSDGERWPEGVAPPWRLHKIQSLQKRSARAQPSPSPLSATQKPPPPDGTSTLARPWPPQPHPRAAPHAPALTPPSPCLHADRQPSPPPLPGRLGNTFHALQSAPASPPDPAATLARERPPPGGRPVVEGRVIADSNALSALHREVGLFARLCEPAPSERRDVDAVVAMVHKAAAHTFGRAARATLFGSRATGLALPGSDLDIVILGGEADALMLSPASGFARKHRPRLVGRLNDLLATLQGMGAVQAGYVIGTAKIPIIKSRMRAPGSKAVLPVDISLGVANGEAAVGLMGRSLAELWPARPVLLVAKALLREHNLNEVFTGGVSSYSLFSMVAAHLVRLGYPVPAAIRSRGDADRSGSQPGAFELNGGGVPGGSASPLPSDLPHDLGDMLLSFLQFFGAEFNYRRDAVSVRRGGTCRKLHQWVSAGRPWGLAVEDPQEDGRDVAAGTYNIGDVQECLRRAAARLRKATRANETAPDAPFDEQAAWKAVQEASMGANGAGGVAAASHIRFDEHMPLLSSIIDVTSALTHGRLHDDAHRAEALRIVQMARRKPAAAPAHPGKRTAEEAVLTVSSSSDEEPPRKRVKTARRGGGRTGGGVGHRAAEQPRSRESQGAKNKKRGAGGAGGGPKKKAKGAAQKGGGRGPAAPGRGRGSGANTHGAGAGGRGAGIRGRGGRGKDRGRGTAGAGRGGSARGGSGRASSRGKARGGWTAHV
ncbi:unnamed protein product [Pedinophyceae sp. YPF-701]|nr:unnamed protein product [Pedinophyceae sp. YPF-701]